MFEKNENGNTLHNHLLADGVFTHDVNTLSIIDDYHTKNITPEAIRFFCEGFQNTGLTTITIYYQIKKIWESTQNQINELSRIIDINPADLTAFLVFLLTSINNSRGFLVDKIRNLYHSGYAQQTISSSIEFIREMSQSRINIRYQPYDSLGFKPPFHGRYWINENMGYIVDGSLNTFTHGKIFGQKMDNDNFNIILGLMHDEIEPRSARYNFLTGQRLEEIHNLLIGYFCR